MANNTGELKKFAQTARRQLREQVAARLDQVLTLDSAYLRERESALKELRQQIALTSKKVVVDRVAYTWFNRFCALRFMDINRYNRISVVSPAEGFTQPEILQEAKKGYIDEDLRPFVDSQVVFDLLGGKSPSRDPQQEAYRLLLVAVCNSYNTVMPFMFERIADFTELLMPVDLLSENSILSSLREAMTPEACQDVEVIGWLYQYYISERKDEVFAALKKNEKIEAKDIPAATQIFTPHWIVRYLVENSLGRLWLLNRPSSKLAEKMEFYIKPVEEEKDYLKISSPEEIKLCDPACGSGHMLTYAFDLLYTIYEEEGYSSNDISRLILEKNLYGIEIDERAGALAAFAVFMKAREKDKRFFSRPTQPNICVLENITFTDQELKEYMNAVGRDLFTEPLRETLKQFEEAENFGSLVRPILTDVSFVKQVLESKNLGGNLLLYGIHERVQKALKQAAYLSPRYQVVVANPPYMGSGGMNEEMKKYLAVHYKDVKSDLFSAFIIRNLDLAVLKGQIGYMAPFVWMFISSYEKLRQYIIDLKTITSLIQLEYSGFDGAVVPICTFTLENSYKDSYKSGFIRLSDFRGAENQAPKALEAIQNPSCGWFYRSSATEFKKIPGSPIAYWVSENIRKAFSKKENISNYGFSDGKNVTGNNEKYQRFYWEIPIKEIGSDADWLFISKGGGFRKWTGPNDITINWSAEARQHYKQDPIGRIIPEYLWNRTGISWGLISSESPSFRILQSSTTFSDVGLFFSDNDHILPVLGFLNSNVAVYMLSLLNPTLNFPIELILKLPIGNIQNLDIVSPIVEKLILLSKQNWEEFETSWGFSENPLINKLHYPQKISENYLDLLKKWENTIKCIHQYEYENNVYMIENFGLGQDISPEIPVERITIQCNPYYRYGTNKSEQVLKNLLLADTLREYISYAVGCIFGRYSLDKPGLILANQGETLQDYLKQIPEPTFIPDEDNAIPILDGDWFTDDASERFKKFLKITFGEEHYNENLAFIEQAIGRDIRSYFLKEFYGEHVKMYKKRPIYWMFSSPNGSFNVLIYMHRYNKDTVSVILNRYLREFRAKLEARKSYMEKIGASSSASPVEKVSALKEIEKLKKTLDEIWTYEKEILYPLATQQIEIDLDDGVKVNYLKFGRALAKIPGLESKE